MATWRRGLFRHLAWGVSVAFVLFSTACAPTVRGTGPTITPPMLTDTTFLSADGEPHRLIRHLPENPDAIRAVVVALHGLNDRAEAFDGIGTYLADHGMALYAYDHRGFAASPSHGLWPGTPALVNDAHQFTETVQQHHPGVPVYLLGESMGGAVVMAMMTSPSPPPVAGIILSAPAVWGRVTMPLYQRWALEISTYTVPWLALSGDGLDVRASDNIEMLHELGRDPLFIKKTRVDVVAGVTDLMDAALAAAPRLTTPALILYGERDEVVPPDPTLQMIRALPDDPDVRQTIALYENGWHLLMRDLQADRVWEDIRAWIDAPAAPLPSRADFRGDAWRAGRHEF